MLCSFSVEVRSQELCPAGTELPWIQTAFPASYRVKIGREEWSYSVESISISPTVPHLLYFVWKCWQRDPHECSSICWPITKSCLCYCCCHGFLTNFFVIGVKYFNPFIPWASQCFHYQYYSPPGSQRASCSSNTKVHHGTLPPHGIKWRGSICASQKCSSIFEQLPQAASPSISAKPFERSANPQVDGWQLHSFESAAQSQWIALKVPVEARCEGRRNWGVMKQKWRKKESTLRRWSLDWLNRSDYSFSLFGMCKCGGVGSGENQVRLWQDGRRCLHGNGSHTSTGANCALCAYQNSNNRS